MKFRTTRKTIKENYSKIIEVGYCQLQHLLSFKNPVAYTCGREGWNADIYDIDGVAIVTGYRPFGNLSANYDICRKYEEEAEQLRFTSNNIDERQKMLNTLISRFIQEVTE